MRARASVALLALMAFGAVELGSASGGGAPASGNAARWRLLETVTLPGGGAVTAKTQFQGAEDYAIVMRGTVESWSDEYPWRNQWDPWYLYGCTGECGDESSPRVAQQDHRPVAFDRRDGTYTALSNLGSGSSLPAFNSEHAYRLPLSDFGGELKLRDRLADSTYDHHAGAFTFAIYRRAVAPIVTYDFLHDNLRGAIKITTKGRGRFELRRRPDLRGERYDKVSAVEGATDGLVLRHRDEYVVRDDDVVELGVRHATYKIRVTDRAVYETVTFETEVTRSNDEDCDEGAAMVVQITEAKGAGGKGKVRIAAGTGCSAHDHRAFTEREAGDTVRVEVKGPKPLRNP